MTTSELAAALGRLGGRSTSPAKLAAVRINLERARRHRWIKPRMVTAEAVRRAVKQEKEAEECNRKQPSMGSSGVRQPLNADFVTITKSG
jgi:hypothetical protein